jgi:hypothetical protein
MSQTIYKRKRGSTPPTNLTSRAMPAYGRTERRNTILDELDEEYEHQLTHLTNMAKRAQFRFMRFNQTHSGGQAEPD